MARGKSGSAPRMTRLQQATPTIARSVAAGLASISLLTASAPALASGSPTVLAGSVRVVLSAQRVLDTAGVTATAAALDPGGTAEYEFWLESPSGTWSILRGYGPSPVVTLPALAAGSYLVAVTALDQAALARGAWQEAVTSLPAGLFVGSSVSVQAAQANIAEGGSISVAAASNQIAGALYQFWVKSPSGVWMSSGSYRGASGFQFPASQMGPYEVVVYAKMPDAPASPAGALCSAPVTVVSYGTPAALLVTPAPATLVADGAESDPVTVAVTDRAGDVVPTFSGTATLSLTEASAVVGAYRTAANAWTPMTTGTTVTLPISQGTASWDLQAGTAVGQATIAAQVTNARRAPGCRRSTASSAPAPPIANVALPSPPCECSTRARSPPGPSASHHSLTRNRTGSSWPSAYAA